AKGVVKDLNEQTNVGLSKLTVSLRRVLGYLTFDDIKRSSPVEPTDAGGGAALASSFLKGAQESKESQDQESRTSPSLSQQTKTQTSNPRVGDLGGEEVGEKEVGGEEVGEEVGGKEVGVEVKVAEEEKRSTKTLLQELYKAAEDIGFGTIKATLDIGSGFGGMFESFAKGDIGDGAGEMVKGVSNSLVTTVSTVAKTVTRVPIVLGKVVTEAADLISSSECSAAFDELSSPAIEAINAAEESLRFKPTNTPESALAERLESSSPVDELGVTKGVLDARKNLSNAKVTTPAVLSHNR
ncbi:MAG: hypothetical protein KGP29_07410, partial [Proteobacteria bacterium]|nr:hypothetical protein [Pseudomonadota bacterium]